LGETIAKTLRIKTSYVEINFIPMSKNKRFLLFALALSLTFLNPVQALQIVPEDIEPVVFNGVKYSAPSKLMKCSRGERRECSYSIEARDNETTKKLWDLEIYKVSIGRWLEEDVQWVFITKVEIRDSDLLVTDGRDRKYLVELKEDNSKPQKVKNIYTPPKTAYELIFGWITFKHLVLISTIIVLSIILIKNRKNKKK
jgi:hypothetical protein